MILHFSVNMDDLDQPDDKNNQNNGNGNRARKRYVFYERTIVAKSNRIPDFLFRRIFRMRRQTFQELLTDCGQFIPIGRSSNGKSLQPPERLLLFLKFLGSNERYIDQWVSIIFDCEQYVQLFTYQNNSSLPNIGMLLFLL